MTPAEQSIVDAAVDVSIFSKTHGYPAEGTPDFFEFAHKLDALATAINAAYPHFNHNVAAQAQSTGWRVLR